jgi:type II secretory pathway pseudopilin PulG
MEGHLRQRYHKQYPRHFLSRSGSNKKQAMKKLFRNQKGFTLVEMVLYVSLCSMILLALSTFLSFLLGSRVRSQSISEVNQQGFQVMHMMTQTIRNGRSITTPALGGASSTLSVITANALLNPTVFTSASGTMKIKEGSNNYISLTNKRVTVSNLLFENVSSSSSTEKIIRISFTVDYLNLSGRDEYSYTKTFKGSATLR